MIFSPLLSIVLGLIAVGIAFSFPKLRREMFWAGILCLPLLGLTVLRWPLAMSEIILLFSTGAILSVIYESFLARHFRFEQQPSRSQLTFLLLGPIVFVFGLIIGGSVFGWLAAAISLNFLVVFGLSKQLIWDAIFSSVMMGLLYIFLFSILPKAVFASFLIDPSGVNVFGVPLEGHMLVFLFGLLWGPVYVAAKDLGKRSL